VRSLPRHHNVVPREDHPVARPDLAEVAGSQFCPLPLFKACDINALPIAPLWRGLVGCAPAARRGERDDEWGAGEIFRLLLETLQALRSR
jgi:hypothetical protein